MIFKAFALRKARAIPKTAQNKGVIMNQLNEQLFPAEFILDYMQDDTGKKRFLTYILFRFLSAAGTEHDNLPSLLKENLSATFTTEDFPVIEAYLAEDYYFSPSPALFSFEPLYLYAAITVVTGQIPEDAIFIEKLLCDYCPAATRFGDSANIVSAPAPQNEAEFYGALLYASIHCAAVLPKLLLAFTEVYQESYHFTCEDFILFDFMDEYFEEKNCRKHPSFVELIDTLVAATLNYYNTDFGTLVESELTKSLAGSSARFAGTKRFGSIQTVISDPDNASHMLAALFRYAAIYELRSNLFDFHLEEDKQITLTNWKENLRWHYVQYANVYNLALDSFQSAFLSKELLKRQFEENLRQLL